MRIIANWLPDGLPVLESGRHPDPAVGGCFMEYASLLAGERWSDHPRCTHPALAELARLINDASPRDARQQLAVLIPDVVGLAGPDPRVAPALVLRCLDAIPASGHRRLGCRIQRRWAAHRVAAAAAGGTGARRCQVTDRIYRFIYRFGPMRHAMARAVRAMGSGPTGAACRRQLLLDAIAVTKNLTTEPASRPSADAKTDRSSDGVPRLMRVQPSDLVRSVRPSSRNPSLS